MKRYTETIYKCKSNSITTLWKGCFIIKCTNKTKAVKKSGKEVANNNHSNKNKIKKMTQIRNFIEKWFNE